MLANEGSILWRAQKAWKRRPTGSDEVHGKGTTCVTEMPAACGPSCSISGPPPTVDSV